MTTSTATSTGGVTDFIATLSGGKPNSLGRTEEVVRIVQGDRRLLRRLFAALESGDELVRLRVGDALEKICREQPEWFVPHFDRILAMGRIDQPSLQWHTAQIVTQMPLNPSQRRRAVNWLWRSLDRTDDWIVIAETLTALVRFAETRPAVRDRLPSVLRRYQRDRRPAVARRATKLLDQLTRG